MGVVDPREETIFQTFGFTRRMWLALEKPKWLYQALHPVIVHWQGLTETPRYPLYSSAVQRKKAQPVG